MISFESFFDTVMFLASHLASFAILSASAWIFGEAVLRRLAIGRYQRRWALAGALGWGLIAQAMFLLGVLGLLDRGLVLTVLALAHMSCFRTWRSVLADRLRPGRLRPGISPLGYIAVLPLFALALYPPIGFDATVYHLPYADAFVEAGGLEFLADLRFPVFPQVGEMGFVLGFFLSGDVAAKLTQLLAILLTAGLLFDWGMLYGRRTGTWAMALWLGNPLIVWLGTSAYVDATLALFVTAALSSWERWARDGNRGWLWLAGAFAGLAAGTKYLGLFFVCALGVLTAFRFLKSRDLRPFVALAAVALAVLAPWYLRIVYHTGNPVFPFYAPIFGSSEWASLHDQTLLGAGGESGAGGFWAVVGSQVSRITDGLFFLALVPWTAVFDRGVFHWQAPLSPYYLLLVPLCAPVALLERHTRRLVVLVAVYGLFWLTTVRDLRFLVAVMPALNVALVAALAGSRMLGNRLEPAKRLRDLVMPLSTGLLLAPGVLYAGYKIQKQGWLPVNAEQRVAYLSRQVPGYQAIAEMNDLEGRDYTVYSLYGENLRYYAEGRFLGDRFGPARYALIEAVLGDSRALAGELKSSGACFFLVLHPRSHELLRPDSHFSRHFSEQAVGDDFVLYRLPEVTCSRATS